MIVTEINLEELFFSLLLRQCSGESRGRKGRVWRKEITRKSNIYNVENPSCAHTLTETVHQIISPTMKFLVLTLLAMVAVARGERGQEKRGVAAGQQTYAAPASIAYSKVQQPVAKVAAAPGQYYQPQPQAYAFPAQQYQPQTVAYQSAPQPAAKQVVAYKQPYSLANDVSSFTYSSPVVTYNNLGLLSQVVGKLAGAHQAKAAAPAPAPVAYQAPVQKFAYSQPAQLAYAQAPQQKIVAAAPQQYFAPAPAPQQAYVSAPQQTYVSAPQAQTYQAAQTYTAQTAPQSIYSQAPQYYSVPQAKQATPGVGYAQ
ncbi:cuticle protein 16.5-like [Tribolium madens]|uniref:cuticle protein 16.5-like n=1 Tax=Tribolium madens TaxID=41895 RepID=UPI001CF7521C|nr:cuticle protein 16.5-like [Tribolium madens]